MTQDKLDKKADIVILKIPPTLFDKEIIESSAERFQKIAPSINPTNTILDNLTFRTKGFFMMLMIYRLRSMKSVLKKLTT